MRYNIPRNNFFTLVEISRANITASPHLCGSRDEGIGSRLPDTNSKSSTIVLTSVCKHSPAIFKCSIKSWIWASRPMHITVWRVRLPARWGATLLYNGPCCPICRIRCSRNPRIPYNPGSSEQCRVVSGPKFI